MGIRRVKQLRLGAAGGFMGAILFVAGDLLLFLTPNYDMAASVQADWNTMGMWRFTMSMWLGIAGMPLLMGGMYSAYVMLKAHYPQRMVRVFWLSGLIGTASTAFSHFILGCMEPLMYKNMLLQGVQEQAAANVLKNLMNICDIPIMVFIILLDGVTAILMVYAIFKGKIGCPKWMVLLNPVILTIIGAMLYYLPFWNGFQGITGAFESLGEGCLYLIPLWYWNKKQAD